MTQTVVGILVGSAIVAAFGQIMLKLGSGRGGSLIATLLDPFTILGLVAYGASLLLWLKALSAAPLHVVYPFTMLTFVLVGLASVVVLGERPNVMTMAGWGVICLGIGIASLGAR